MRYDYDLVIDNITTEEQLKKVYKRFAGYSLPDVDDIPKTLWVLESIKKILHGTNRRAVYTNITAKKEILIDKFLCRVVCGGE